MRNAMVHGVFDQRLQQQGGYPHGHRFLRHFHAAPQSIAKAHLLDGEEGLDQGQLIGQRDRLLRAEFEALAEEVRHQQAHAPGGNGIRADQCRDRIQAVEQEVRIELAPQETHFCLARIGAQLQGAPFRIARALTRRLTKYRPSMASRTPTQPANTSSGIRVPGSTMGVWSKALQYPDPQRRGPQPH